MLKGNDLRMTNANIWAIGIVVKSEINQNEMIRPEAWTAATKNESTVRHWKQNQQQIHQSDGLCTKNPVSIKQVSFAQVYIEKRYKHFIFK